MEVPAGVQQSIRFGPFTVDLLSRELWNGSQKVPLQEKPFQLLVILLENPGKLVTREDLRERLWPADTFVDFDHSINTAINKIRETLGDSSDQPRFIETLPRRGYRFRAPVENSEAEHPTPLTPAGEFEENSTPDPEPIEVAACVGSLEATVRRYDSGGSYSRRRLRVVLAFISILAAVAALIVYRYARWRVGPAESAPSIAVLPFADLSPGHDHEYFSDGLAEEILNNLTKIPNLQVAARSSAFQFRGANKDPQAIGQKLNVTNLLEGSVQSAGNRVRISVHLTKADVGLSLWSDTYDRDLKDIFAVEDDIAAAVSAALQPKLLGRQPATTPPASRPTNPEAYQAFLQARYFDRRSDVESENKAFAYVNRAIQLDQSYAPAYAQRAVMTAEAAGMGRLDLSAATQNSRRDAEEAIALDPNLAAGYLALSETQAMAQWDWQGAERSVERARELAPGDADVLGQSGFLAMCRGHLQEAGQRMSQGIALDPLQPAKHLYLGQLLRDLGRYEEAHAALDKALELSPNQVWTHETQGEVYLAQGRLQNALLEMEKEPKGPFRTFGEALVYHALGRFQDSDAALARLIAQNRDDAAWQIAQAYAYRGETDQAFLWLDRTCRQHDFGVGHLQADWTMRNLRSDPRYTELLNQLNLRE
jgi:TolB-like protein/DNA-binding winged helix-turn-helix (wHTH) protein/Flp pilus assembly protein TadD